MPCAAADRQTTGPRDQRGSRLGVAARSALRRLALPVLWALSGLLALPLQPFGQVAQAQTQTPQTPPQTQPTPPTPPTQAPVQPQPLPPSAEIVNLSALRGGDTVAVDYQLRVNLPPAVEEAALRGVPLYFVATATLWRQRWYWRDERVARTRREWRLSFQPLTSSWRVSQGGLGQSHATLAEALATMTGTSGWRLADAAQAEADGRHYVEFEWALDTSQLPRPLQIGVTGVGGVGGGNDWALGVERTVKLAQKAAAPPSASPPPQPSVTPPPASAASAAAASPASGGARSDAKAESK
jgi:Domain of unknown function (DUF4390)